MIEKFREWNPRGMINVRYKDGSGKPNVWTVVSSILLNNIKDILRRYSAQNIILTNRQLYYQLVAADLIPNAQEVYKRICKFLTDARYGGHIDWSAIEDRGRTPEKHSEWNNVKDLISSAVASYRLPRWKDQDYYVELYCEKQAMESVLKPIADKYHIYFGANKGYSSASTMYDLAQRIKEQIIDGRSAIILYLGDHDPSGLDMIRDIRARINEFLTASEDSYIDADFKVIPVALNMQQIKKYNPPPNPAKITDPRAKGYIAEFGNKSWELDALKPEVLNSLTESAIQDYIDVDKYNAWIELEKKQKQALKEFGEELDEESD